MANAKNIEAGGAYVRLFTEESDMVRGLRRAEKNFHAWGARMSRIGSFGGTGILSGMGLNAGNLGLAGLAAGMTLSVKKFADTGSALNDLSSRTGASTDALQKLSFAAKMTGSDSEALEAGIQKLGKNIGEALGGDKAANQMFASLGLSARQLAGMNVDQQFEVIAERLSRIPEGALRTKATMDLLGKSGTALIPMLAGGGAELAAYGKRLEELGVIKTPQAIAAADDLGDRMDEVGMVLAHTAFVVGDALAPMVMELADNVIEIAKSANEWIDQNEGVITTVAMVTAGVGAAGAGLLALGTATTVAAIGFGVMATAATTAAAAATAVVTPLGLIAVAAGGIGFIVARESVISTEALNDLETTAVSTWEGITDAVAAGDLGLAMDVTMAGMELAWTSGLAEMSVAWDTFVNGVSKPIEVRLDSPGTWWAGARQAAKRFVDPEGTAAAENVGAQADANRRAEILHQAGVADAQKKLDDLKQKAADKKAKADADRDKKTSNKKPRSGDAPQLPDAKTAGGGGPRGEATTSGLAASLNRGFGSEDRSPAGQMTKFGTAADVTTRKIDEQTEALKRRNQANEKPPKPLFFAEPVDPAKKAAAQEKQAAKLAEANAKREELATKRRLGDFGPQAQAAQEQQDKREARRKRLAGLSPLYGLNSPHPSTQAAKEAGREAVRAEGEAARAEQDKKPNFWRRGRATRGNSFMRQATAADGTPLDNRTKFEREQDALDAKITDADANAKAFAGMAKEPLPSNQPPTLIKAPQQALPVSQEGKAAIDAARNMPLTSLESLDAKFAALFANLPMPDIATRFGNLRMPDIGPPPLTSSAQSVSARDNDKLDVLIDQMKQLNANVRAGGVLTT